MSIELCLLLYETKERKKMYAKVLETTISGNYHHLWKLPKVKISKVQKNVYGNEKKVSDRFTSTVFCLNPWCQQLTLLLLNTTCPVLAKSVDPDQLASSLRYVNFYQKPESSNLIGWKLEVCVAS